MTGRIRRAGRVFMPAAEAMPQPDDFHQRIRALEALPGGLAIYKIKVFEDTVVVTAGDGKFKFDIPEDLDEAVLVKAEAWITTTPSTGGDIQIALWNDTQSHNMLSTKITIDEGDLNSRYSATPHVINVANADVEWADEIWINVDDAGGGAVGLGITLYFSQIPNTHVLVQGQKGPPGGVTDFQGNWTITTVYNAGDVVVHNGVTYLVTVTHTSDATTEPGAGIDWETVLAPLIDLPDLSSAFEVVLEGHEYPIDIGVKAFMEVPYDCEIVSATLLANIAGSIIIDIWRDGYGSFPPTDADSITSVTPPTIASGMKTQDTALTGWTTALTEGDILAFHVDSCNIINRVTLSLKVERPV